MQKSLCKGSLCKGKQTNRKDHQEVSKRKLDHEAFVCSTVQLSVSLPFLAFLYQMLYNQTLPWADGGCGCQDIRQIRRSDKEEEGDVAGIASDHPWLSCVGKGCRGEEMVGTGVRERKVWLPSEEHSLEKGRHQAGIILV